MDGKKYEMMQTKVSPHTYHILRRIEKQRGISTYVFIQMVADTLARYTDDRHNLSLEMERLISMFEHMEGWSEAFNLADPTVNQTVGEAIYFLYDADGKKKGTRAVHVTKPFFGDWTEDVNILHILDRAFKLLLPELYRHLSRATQREGYTNIVEFIRYLIMQYVDDTESDAIRQEFEDNNRGDYGQKPHEGGPYVRHHTKHVENEEFNFPDNETETNNE